MVATDLLLKMIWVREPPTPLVCPLEEGETCILFSFIYKTKMTAYFLIDLRP
jgi:hypothetical protein